MEIWNRYSRGMAYASVSKEALGVRVTEGEGNLPKVVLTSAGGRCVFFYYLISTFHLLLLGSDTVSF